MTRLLGIVAIYVVMFLGWTGVGAFLLLAPIPAGNLIHDSFGLFPAVRPNDRVKKLVLRAAGLGLPAFAAHFAVGVARRAGRDGI
jgi:hypothetical protein